MSTSADDLLDQAASGNHEALAALLEQYGPRIRQGLAGQIPTRWQAVLSADDVMQQSYVDAFMDISGFDPRGEGSFIKWLRTLTRRNLLDAIRMLEAEKRGKRRRNIRPPSNEKSLVALYEQLGCTRSTPSRHAARNEACVSLRHAIEELPSTYRRVVEMYDLEGRPVENVAAAMKRSPGAIFMLRSRAHRRLHELMGTASLYLSD